MALYNPYKRGIQIDDYTADEIRDAAEVPERVFPYTFTKRALWQPYPNGTTVTTALGVVAPTAVGTVTTRNVAATNIATRSWRQGFVSAAGAGSLVGCRIPSSLITVGNGASPPLGGFGVRIRFVPSDAATVNGSRFWVGITNFTGAFTNNEPSAITNGVGVGWGAADTNLKLFYGGSAAQTPIDLGANFPARTLSADLYELKLFAPPDEANTIYYTVDRNRGQFVATGTLTGAATVIPQSTTLLTPLNALICNNATALAVGIDYVEVLIETD
jgi:hypothetical protein